MLIVCAWCKRQLDEREDRSVSERAVTHGICERCAWLFEEFEPVQLGSLAG